MAVAVILCVLLAIWSAMALSSSDNGFRKVSLTIEEEGVSLTGPHCPGTVRLVCEGVDLTVLRWRYNEDIDIGVSFTPDDMPDIVDTPLPTVFISLELRNVSQSLSLITANFTSVLTANLSQLEKENVASISCGNAAVVSTLPVDITIINELNIEDPQITNVNTTQNSSDVQLTLHWEQQSTQGQGCTVNESLLVEAYIVTLFWNGTNYTMTVNSSSCGAQCFVEFSIRSLERDENYTVYLQAVNDDGMTTFNATQSGTIAAVIECSAPQPPLNGSIDNHLSSAPLGTTVTYHCDLYPDDVQTSICLNVSGSGEWVPEPSDFDCSERELSTLATGSANLCTMPFVNELEHGSLTRLANISNGVLIQVQCDDGYTLSGPSIITCTATEGLSTDFEAIQCTALVIAIAAGVSGGVLTIATVVLVVIVIKCAYSRYQKKGSAAINPSISAEEKEAKLDMGMYNTLSHPGVMPTQTDCVTDNVVIYEEIAPPSSKSLSYADVSTQKVKEPTALPTPWSPVDYVTVDTKVTGTDEGGECQDYIKMHSSGFATKAEPPLETKAEALEGDMTNGVHLDSDQTIPDMEQRPQPVVTDIKDIKLKTNKSYGMVEMQCD